MFSRLLALRDTFHIPCQNRGEKAIKKSSRDAIPVSSLRLKLVWLIRTEQTFRNLESVFEGLGRYRH